MDISPLIAAWLAGTLGGAHCVAMCGGFVAALSGAGRLASEAPLVPARTLASRALTHNLGRITTYALLGTILGGVGALALSAAEWLPLQRTLYLIANLFLLALAAAILWNRDALAVLQRAGAAMFARALPAVRVLRARDGALARYGLGMIWGLVPCALTYSVLPIAAFAGGAFEGGAVMLAFGLGTLPNLLAAAWVVTRAREWLGSRIVRYGAAALLAGFAGLGVWRAMYGSLASAHGAFCF